MQCENPFGGYSRAILTTLSTDKGSISRSFLSDNFCRQSSIKTMRDPFYINDHVLLFIVLSYVYVFKSFIIVLFLSCSKCIIYCATTLFSDVVSGLCRVFMIAYSCVGQWE